jgi:hypothetical protein
MNDQYSVLLLLFYTYSRPLDFKIVPISSWACTVYTATGATKVQASALVHLLTLEFGSTAACRGLSKADSLLMELFLFHVFVSHIFTICS